MVLDGALALVVIGLLSLGSQWLAWLFRLPAILPLLLVGIALGPISGLLQPERLFGELLMPVVSLAVAVILFEGALTLKWGEIRQQARVVGRLVSIGMGVTFIGVWLGSHYLLGLDWVLAALFAAISVVTGPTVIAPLLRVVRPKAELDRILRWEGILIDPIGAIFAVLVFTFIEAVNPLETGAVWLEVGRELVLMLLVGLAVGCLGGLLIQRALKRVLFPHYLQNFAMLVMVLGLYWFADNLVHESGLLAVTVLGIWLANCEEIDLTDVLKFKEDLSVMLISALFIILAARVDLNALIVLGPAAIGLLAWLQLGVRPLAVLASTLGSELSWRDRALLGWIAPRGIVAAAVSTLFALRLEEAGYPGADQLVPLVFLVIIGTVVFQSLTSATWARWLGVRHPPANGVLIVGAAQVGRDIARCLQGAGVPVTLVDHVWENYRLARMEGLNALYSSPFSEQTENRLDLSSINLVLGLSPNRHENALAIYHFNHLFGAERVFAVASAPGRERSHQESRISAEQVLFDSTLSYAHLSQLLRQGALLKQTRLNENFSWSDFQDNWQQVVPLFRLDDGDQLRPVTGTEDPEQWQEDVQLLALVLPKAETFVSAEGEALPERRQRETNPPRS